MGETVALPSRAASQPPLQGASWGHSPDQRLWSAGRAARLYGKRAACRYEDFLPVSPHGF